MPQDIPIPDRPFFDVVDTQRSVRRFRPDPVPEELIRRVLEATVKAPNASNNQTWRFLVVTDPDLRARIGALYAEALAEQRGRPLEEEEAARRGASHTLREAIHLALHFGEAPVHIVACDSYEGPFGAGPTIYPACQNLMLAAWALGLGTVITTVWARRQTQLRALLRVPREYSIYAIIPLGWPARAYGPPRRRPATDVAYRDLWGQPLGG